MEAAQKNHEILRDKYEPPAMSHGAVCKTCGCYAGVMYYCDSCRNTFCETHALIPPAGQPDGVGLSSSMKAEPPRLCRQCGKGIPRKIQG